MPHEVRATSSFREAIEDLHYDHSDLLTVIAENDAQEILRHVRNHKGTPAERYDHLCFIAYTSGFSMPVPEPSDAEYISEYRSLMRR